MNKRFSARRVSFFPIGIGISLGIFACNQSEDGAQTAQVLYRAIHTPCGEMVAKTGSQSADYTFTGYEQDPQLSLLDAGARFYDTTLCRFSSTDPIDQHGESSYTYAGNNMLRYIDPSGRQHEEAGLEIKMPQLAIRDSRLDLMEQWNRELLPRSLDLLDTIIYGKLLPQVPDRIANPFLKELRATPGLQVIDDFKEATAIFYALEELRGKPFQEKWISALLIDRGYISDTRFDLFALHFVAESRQGQKIPFRKFVKERYPALLPLEDAPKNKITTMVLLLKGAPRSHEQFWWPGSQKSVETVLLGHEIFHDNNPEATEVDAKLHDIEFALSLYQRYLDQK